MALDFWMSASSTWATESLGIQLPSMPGKLLWAQNDGVSEGLAGAMTRRAGARDPLQAKDWKPTSASGAS